MNNVRSKVQTNVITTIKCQGNIPDMHLQTYLISSNVKKLQVYTYITGGNTGVFKNNV